MAVERPIDEDEWARRNRQLSEVLGEIRIAMPGVQVLFGFLLAVPFGGQFFEEADAFQEAVYLFALLTAGMSSALFITPTAYHRVTFGLGEKARLVEIAARCAILGLITLALSMTACVLLVSSVILGRAGGMVVAALGAAMFAFLWFGLGLHRRRELAGREDA